MEPLIDDLVHAWEEGVWTYDRATKTNFKMHVWYQYSLHDLLAYGIFCCWCVHRKFSCLVCKVSLMFIWLMKGGKYSSFDKHRQFLPLDHPFRRGRGGGGDRGYLFLYFVACVVARSLDPPEATDTS